MCCCTASSAVCSVVPYTVVAAPGEGQSGDASNGKGTNQSGQGGTIDGLTVVEGTKNGAGFWGKLKVGEQTKNGGATDRSDTSSSTAVA